PHPAGFNRMSMSATTTLALVHNLKRLAVLRLITCSGIALALWFFGQESASPLQRFGAWGILLLMTLLSLVNLWRARSHSARPHEMSSYLLVDTLLIVALMYLSGGANNPFITYLLVPIVISAATLSWLMTWLLCVLAMLAYGGLLFFYEPLASLEYQLAQLGLSQHIVGMWLTFVLSSLFIAYFVVEMALENRLQSQQVAQYREQSIQSEHLMLLASQAASTAHELGTPLTTLKILSQELRHQTQDEQSQADLDLMLRQIELCKDKLKHLSQHQPLEQSPHQSLQLFIHHALEQWLLMRPTGQYRWQEEHSSSPRVQYPQVLQQAIINLLDNAYDASHAPVELALSWNKQHWTLNILDHGPGVAPEFTLPNRPIDSSQGLGIGLLLSHSSIQRLGGNVTLCNQAQGCLTVIEIPFNEA
ncbi:MAG: ATP-binding protein, partial [Bermanella sp.]